MLYLCIGNKGNEALIENLEIMTREEFHQLPVFYQELIASKNGILKDKRERTKEVQRIVDKTRVQSKGYTGEEAPTYFYACGRDLYAEIIAKGGVFVF